MFLYGGCLGYEYYIKPILHGKGDSWAKLDIVSSVIEVTVGDSTFGVSGVRDNCFTPTGSRCN